MEGAYRTPDGKAQIEWELTGGEHGPKFSACGEFDGGAGQCLDSIAKAYPKDEMVRRIVKVWRLYHLNDTTAGLPEQEAAIKALTAAGNKDDYTAACEHLEGLGLLSVPIPEGAQALGGFEREGSLFWEDGKSYYRNEPAPDDALYQYGTRWIYAAIPDEVLTEIRSWADAPQPAESLHEAQAKAFLTDHGLTLRAKLADTKPPAWNQDHTGHHYRVTISRKGGGRITFDFWGSEHDADEGNEPTPYGVLAAISGDAYAPETFDEWCSEYGENEDSRTALQTFNRCNRFAQRLRAFFKEEELADLADIR